MRIGIGTLSGVAKQDYSYCSRALMIHSLDTM